LAVKVTKRFPTYGDMVNLAENMRQLDVDEIEAVHDLEILPCIEYSVRNAEKGYCFAVFCNDILVGIYGCSVVGNPWLLATNEMNHYVITLTRRTKHIVRMMSKRWPILSNIVDCRNKMTIRWLKTIGFTFEETIEIKPGFPVIRFEMVNNEVFSTSRLRN